MKSLVILFVISLSQCVHNPPKTATVARVCPDPAVYIAYGVMGGWNDDDNKQLLTSSKRCPQKFGEYSCLISLTKLGDKRYNAVCGNVK